MPWRGAHARPDCPVPQFLYLQFGAGDNKKKTALTQTNTLDRAVVFFQRWGREPMTASLDQVLVQARSRERARQQRCSVAAGTCPPLRCRQMFRTGRYYVGTDWVVGNRGQPMDRLRAQLAFGLTIVPQSADLASVRAVFLK